jgi:hypothetical protein
MRNREVCQRKVKMQKRGKSTKSVGKRSKGKDETPTTTPTAQKMGKGEHSAKKNDSKY